MNATSQRLVKLHVRTLHGITKRETAALVASGARTIAALRNLASKQAGIDFLLQQEAMEPTRLQTWLTYAELCRVPGVATQYAALLVRAGIDTPRDLATVDVTDLRARLMVANVAGQRLCRQIPETETLARWISGAAELCAELVTTAAC